MTSSYDYSSVDDDFLLADDRGYVGGGGAGSGDNFWSMKQNETRKVYFTTPGPWTKEADHGWWNWREIFAASGLTGAGELPPGMKAFPVRDQETYVDGDGNRRRRDIRADSPDYDQLLALVVPYVPDRGNTRNKSPQRPVRDVIGVSVVEVDPAGQLYPKVLTMTGNRYRKISEILSSFRAMNRDGFTLVGYPWMFGFSGEASAEIAILRPLPDEPPIDLPDPHDIPELLQAKRAAVFGWVQQATGVDTSAYARAETAAPAEATAPAEAGTAPAEPWEPPAEPPVDEEPPSRAEVYSAMTDTRLKTLLGKKGVTVNPRTDRDQLIALAVEHGV